MIELLLSLCASLLVSSLAVLYIQLCFTLMQVDAYQQDQFAILQLRQFLATSHSIEVKDNELRCIHMHQSYTIRQDKHRLVKQGGYEILMEQIDHVKIYETNSKIYITYSKDKKEYTFQIA